MTKSPTQQAVSVEHTDRVIAWDHRPHAYCAADYDPWMAGRYDSIKVIQDFARHRLSAALTAERLMSALKPFAREADAWSPEKNAGHVFDDNERVDIVDHIRVGDLRRARAAHSDAGKKK